MDVWLQIALTSGATVLASSGFWAYLRSRNKTTDARDRLMMGIAYDKITSSGPAFIQRGWMTKEDYEELVKYYYEPYKALGGNGLAELIMERVSQLPLSHHNKYAAILPEPERFINNVRVVSGPHAPEETPSE